MSVASASPSTSRVPTLAPLALKASLALLVPAALVVLALLAPVLAFSLGFFSTILAMAQTPQGGVGG
jgi:hypothetical protein